MSDYTIRCESCGTRVPFDRSVSAWDGECDLCLQCHAEWEAEARACNHVWVPHDRGGGRVCERCSLVDEPPQPEGRAGG